MKLISFHASLTTNEIVCELSSRESSTQSDFKTILSRKFYVHVLWESLEGQLMTVASADNSDKSKGSEMSSGSSPGMFEFRVPS